MRLLNVSLVRCPANVQESIRKARPQLAGLKVISLIAKRDLSVLEAYHQSRSAKSFEVCSTNPLESRANVEKSRQNSAFLKLEMDFSQGARGKLPALPFQNATSRNKLAKEKLFSLANIPKTRPPTATETTTRTAPTQAVEMPQRLESGSENDSDASSDEEGSSGSFGDEESSDGSAVEDNLQQEHADEVVLLLEKRKLDSFPFKSVIKEVKAMKEFYISACNFRRRSPRMTASTWAKNLERLVTFWSFCLDEFNRKPTMALVDDMTMVESFVKHLQSHRSVKNTTCARYIHALIVTSKFIHADQSRKNYEEVDSVCHLRALQGQLERAGKVFDEKRAPSVKLFWPQYQELVRSLHSKYEEATGVVKARLHMDFTMLLLFAVNPGRSKELRTLCLLRDVEENAIQEAANRLPVGDNAIIFSKNGPVWLVEKGYKTLSKHGPNVVEFDSEFQFLTYHLREYCSVSRPKLLPRKDLHDYFFVNKHGMPFSSSGSFSNYLARLFKENLGFSCGINEMRHALVEYFRSSPESSDTRLAESLARVCKHSLRTQINIYDRRTEPERRSQALRYLNRSAVNFIFEEAPTTSADVSDEERDDLPAPGEICALVASDAVAKNPEVFLAKVLKYTPDGKNARLAWLKELESRPDHYQFQAGTDVWQERTSALLYPVDVTYHRSDGTYELRTPKERIYALVSK